MKTKFKNKSELQTAILNMIVEAGKILRDEGIEIYRHFVKFDGCFEEMNQSTELDLSWRKINIEYYDMNVENSDRKEITVRAIDGVDGIVRNIKSN